MDVVILVLVKAMPLLTEEPNMPLILEDNNLSRGGRMLEDIAGAYTGIFGTKAKTK